MTTEVQSKTAKELKAEIAELVAQIGPIQAKVSELSAKLIITSIEEIRNEALHKKASG